MKRIVVHARQSPRESLSSVQNNDIFFLQVLINSSWLDRLRFAYPTWCWLGAGRPTYTTESCLQTKRTPPISRWVPITSAPPAAILGNLFFFDAHENQFNEMPPSFCERLVSVFCLNFTHFLIIQQFGWEPTVPCTICTLENVKHYIYMRNTQTYTIIHTYNRLAVTLQVTIAYLFRLVLS